MAAMRMFSGQRLMGGSGLTLPVLKRTRSLMNACLPSIIPASFPSPTMRSHMRSAPMWAQRMGLLGVPLIDSEGKVATMIDTRTMGELWPKYFV